MKENGIIYDFYYYLYPNFNNKPKKEAVDHLLPLDILTKIEHLLMTCITYIDVTRMHVLH